jgi:predicted nucleic acid-binding protein
LDKLVSLFRVIPVNTEIAKTGGLYKRQYYRSHGVGLADAIIAVSVEAENSELKTLNISHYPMMKGLAPAYEK